MRHRMSTGQTRKRLAIAAVMLAPTVAAVLGGGTAAFAATTGSLGEPPLSELAPLIANGSNPVDAFAAGVTARASRASSYGGIAAVNHGQDLNVYLAGTPDATLESQILGTAPADHVHLVQTSHTQTQLLDLRTRVLGEASTLEGRGINLTSWGPDVWTGLERVQVQNLTPATAATLDTLFGASNISLVSSTASTGGIASGTRVVDTKPFDGGDFIQGADQYAAGYVDNCTSGFGAHAGNSYYLLGAQHCYASGTAITQNSSYITTSGTSIGTVATVDDNYAGLDALEISTPNTPLYPTAGEPGSSPAILTAGSTSPQTADVSGAETSPAGYQVCEDGAYEGEICGLVVQSTGSCINLTESVTPSVIRYACDEDYATNPSGGIANGEGDSGSGVFRFNGALLEATGIDSASGTGIACQAYTTNGRQCFSDIFYT